MVLPDFTRVLRIFDDVSAPLGRHLSELKRDELGRRLSEKADQLRPTIMVYGIYNAGKSTLLNALMGQAEAKMADRPETSAVTAYPWGAYTLLDTPGIDAPAEHEAVAQQQLANSEVVLFVVAAGGATDEASTWDQLVDIVAGGRRVMLIVNNKAGIKIGDHDYIGITDNLRRHLQNSADKKGIQEILDKVPVHWVNAKSALRGRLENKKALEAASGVLDLEGALSKFLAESNVATIFSACCKDLSSAIDSANIRLMAMSSDRQLEEMENAKQQINNERVRLNSLLKDHLARECQKVKRFVAGIMGDMAQGGGTDSGQVGACVEAEVMRMHEGLMGAFSRELEEAQQRLGAIGERLNASRLEQVHANISGELGADGNVNDSVFGVAVMESIHNHRIGEIFNPETTQKIVFNSLEFGKKHLPDLFKGIGKKTMERWAGVAGRWAGPLFQIGSALYGVYSAVSANNAEKEKLERRTKAIEDCANTFIGELHDGYQQQIYLMVKQVFKPADDWMAEQSKNLKLDNQLAKNDLCLFEQALIELRAFN